VHASCWRKPHLGWKFGFRDQPGRHHSRALPQSCASGLDQEQTSQPGDIRVGGVFLDRLPDIQLRRNVLDNHCCQRQSSDSLGSQPPKYAQ